MKQIEAVRHSLAHILAYAVKELYPAVKFGTGPAIENGFYYDFDFGKISNLKSQKSKPQLKTQNLTPEDLPKIEAKMQEIIRQNLPFKKKNISKIAAKKLFKNQPFKLELIEEKSKTQTKNQKFTIYQSGNFVDLCKGPHVKSTKEINPDAFKLNKIAGAYWKGDEKNKMLTRIYGLAFETKEELEKYIKIQEESEKRDHRILGQKLELFLIDEKIGQGLPVWLPKGAVIRKEIENYLYGELTKEDYQWLYSPHIGSRKLWEISGHWNFYSESMYPVLEVGQSLEEAQKGKKAEIKEEYLLKPMNCPFHVLVYNSKIRSYKELPIKFAELGTVYRYERSGTLHGIARVRGFTQDDAHIICTKQQMPSEIEKLVKHGIKMLQDFGFKDFGIYLSTRPEKKYVGSLAQWKKATDTLEYVLKKLKLKYQIDKGGGVFYGPKIDIKIKDALEREWQCTTIQFDFNLPKRFNIKFINEKGRKEEPYIIHRALLGSLERFFAVLIEHYAGAFPLWLAPIQVVIINVGSSHKEYVKNLKKELSSFRVEVKDENETVAKRIRDAEMQKIPYILVVGDKEIASKSVNVRERGKKDLKVMKIYEFINKIKNEINIKK